MDPAATIRRVYDLISAGDIDGLSTAFADGFVDHELLPGYAPTKEGAVAFFRMLITAFPDRETKAEAFDLGATAVLAKPFSVDELRAVVLGAGPPQP